MTGPPPPRTPQGPCRREMEDVLSRLKFLNTLSPRGAHIPNCDRKGFYKKKQVSGCRPRPLARGQPPQPRPLLPPGRAESPSPSGKGPRDPEGHNTPPRKHTRGPDPLPRRQGPVQGPPGGAHAAPLCSVRSAAPPKAGSAASAGAWTSTGSPSRATARRAEGTCTVTAQRASDLAR